MAAYSFAVKPQSSNRNVNRPLVDTGWRVGMPVGSNPPTSEPVQSHMQAARGAITQASAWELSTPHPGKPGLASPIQFVRVWGYGVFGK